ncbi:hypothetical protein CY34DRAFT_259691 [Suillus luteus UH-Slu-Lm8-n1]|uniref:Uncharacterized protein n=1 Tax=Suillus luteus UH-Slu-Lm8-n1 TaxID=930992 RepID=A0A0D0B282_9AGAM|nr:hypothetical protein CY34DRAFT_259691 [Suillus luteus UH-Slu-Lm8-n1]
MRTTSYDVDLVLDSIYSHTDILAAYPDSRRRGYSILELYLLMDEFRRDDGLHMRSLLPVLNTHNRQQLRLDRMLEMWGFQPCISFYVLGGYLWRKSCASIGYQEGC